MVTFDRLLDTLQECITEDGAHCLQHQETPGAMANRLRRINEICRAALRDAGCKDDVEGEEDAMTAHESELIKVLVQAIEASGFSVCGPADSRTAENGEPAWVCNARSAIADALGGAN